MLSKKLILSRFFFSVNDHQNDHLFWITIYSGFPRCSMVLEYLPTFNWVILDKGSFVGVHIPAPCFAYDIPGMIYKQMLPIQHHASHTWSSTMLRIWIRILIRILSVDPKIIRGTQLGPFVLSTLIRF